MSDDPEPDDEHAQPHDALFRFVMSNLDDARAALRGMLPAGLVERVDWSTLEPIPTRVTDADLRHREPDAAFRVMVDGLPVKLALLLEHQSTIDRDMALRVEAVRTAFWQAEFAAGEPLSVLVPIVVHHGERPWNAARSMRERVALPSELAQAFAPLLSDARYLLFDLAALDVHALAQAPIASPVVRVAFLVLQRARHSTTFADDLRTVTRDLVAIGARLDGERAFVAIFRYSLVVSKAPRREVGAALEEAMGANMAARVLGTGAQEYFDDGVQLGIEKGEARALLRLAERRFGPLAPDTRSLVERASLEQLERWLDRVLVANDLNELFADPT